MSLLKSSSLLGTLKRQGLAGEDGELETCWGLALAIWNRNAFKALWESECE